MKKVVQIVFVLILLICICRYAKIEETVSFIQEPEKEDYASETDKETENEAAGQIRSTVIGDVEILEKSLQTTIEVEGWSRIRTWDLKYPYFEGEQVVLLGEINNQIYEWVRNKNMVDSEGVYYTELTYEITYMDERFASILFEGEGGGNSYYGYSHGMSFDLKTGELLSLTDFYEWPEWKDLMENAMEQGQLRTQILRGYMELEEDANREYLEEYFIPMFQEDSDLKKDNLDFFIKDGYVYFITHAYPSCRKDSYVRWEVPLETEAFESARGSVPRQIADISESRKIETQENILTDSSVIDLGNHIIAYRASSDIIGISYQGEYLAIHDLISNKILYLPDVYEEVYDMAIEENEGIFINYGGTEENTIQKVHIPVQFPMQTNTVYEIKTMNTKLLTELKGDIKACVEELPKLIWEESAVWEGRIYEITFERISPVYLNPHSEAWGRYADYCLMVKDEEDNIVSEQIMVNYAVPYEEVYWFTDFSGDGFPDIAFCTNYENSRETYVHLEFMIWNAETEEYEAKPLPVRSIGMTAWNDKISSVVLFYKGREFNGKERVSLGMYSFFDGDWELVAELIPIFEEDVVDENGDLLCIGWKEIFYENGDAVEENSIIKEEKTYTPWFDEESIWSRYNRENSTLYPGHPSKEWDIIEVMIGEDTINKYVREQ